MIFGRSLLAVERFRDSARNMAIYDALDHRATLFRDQGKRCREFLPEVGYAAVLEA